MTDEKQSRAGPKDFFLWLAIVATLYWSIGAYITLVFGYIDFAFPDELQRFYDPYSGPIRFSIASLTVIFPLFIFLLRLAHQDARKHPEKRELGVRRWLLYLTVFVAGASLVIDLVFLIDTFLSGDLTTRFLLKVLTVLMVAGSVLGYFFAEIRGRWEVKERQSVTLGGLAAAVVLVSVIAGLFVIGSPGTAREIRLDQQRVADLQNLQWQIVNFWRSKGELPPDLEALVDPISGLDRLPVDPVSEEPYGYRATGDLSFELCASFAQPSPDEFRAPEAPGPMGRIPEGSSWRHNAGPQCFERTIDPDFFDDERLPREPEPPRR